MEAESSVIWAEKKDVMRQCLGELYLDKDGGVFLGFPLSQKHLGKGDTRKGISAMIKCHLRQCQKREKRRRVIDTTREWDTM